MRFSVSFFMLELVTNFNTRCRLLSPEAGKPAIIVQVTVLDQ